MRTQNHFGNTLGQDLTDPYALSYPDQSIPPDITYNPGTFPNIPAYEPQMPVLIPTGTIFGPPATDATIIADAASPGYGNPDYIPPNPGKSTVAVPAIASALQNIFAPSPKVSSVPASANPLTQSSIVSGIPNWGIFAGAAVAALLLFGGSGRRR